MNGTWKATIEQAANALREARAGGHTIARISETYDITSQADAYAVAKINVEAQMAEGRRIVGRKVGLTSRAVQQQLGVDQPDFGILLDDMEYLNDADIPIERLLQPKVEAEIAFVLGSDLKAERPSWCEFLRALAYTLPAIEVVDSAINDWKITLFDTVADNASSGFYVLGDQPVSLGACDLRTAGMQMTVDGKAMSLGTGAACLGHPLRAAYWLACTMCAQGVTMKAGEVILSGALGPMVPVGRGARVEAMISGVGGCSATFI